MCKPTDRSKELSILQPKSWEDYIPFAGWLIYKKLLIIFLVIIILLLSGILVWLLMPEPEPDPLSIPVYYYSDELLKLYSGQVIIVNESDKIIYRGQVENGLRSGWGKSFFPVNGSMIYEGEFRGDLYEGQGTLFDIQEIILYKGQFANGVFNGRGTLFEKNIKTYEGEFANGLPDGEGIQYDESGKIRYQGGFARGVREGAGLEIGSDGTPVYEGEFREDMYDGNGVLYTAGGSRLRFEGVFINGKPARSGKIYNLQGQLLYEGPVLNGKVDCVGLLGLGASDWKSLVMEKPVVYFDGGSVGYLYGELGIAAVGVYAVEPPAYDSGNIQLENSGESAEYAEWDASRPEPETQEPEPIFSSDDILFYTMLIEGRQYTEQIPFDESAGVTLETVDGFEDFMSSRLAAVEDPTVKIKKEAEITRIDNNTYRVSGLPKTTVFEGDAFYNNLIYYYFSDKDLSKGGSGDIIHCRKRQFGG